MFQFPEFAPLGLVSYPRVTIVSYGRVTPFGNPRVKAYLTALRGISLFNKRPSSPLTAKISNIYS